MCMCVLLKLPLASYACIFCCVLLPVVMLLCCILLRCVCSAGDAYTNVPAIIKVCAQLLHTHQAQAGKHTVTATTNMLLHSSQARELLSVFESSVAVF